MARIGLFHPSFSTVGGAELLVASQAAALQRVGHEPRLITFDFAPTWRFRFTDISVNVAPHHRLFDFLTPWDKVGHIRRRGRGALPYFQGCERILAFNYPCSDMLGSNDVTIPRYWQCNEPPRGLHLPLANPRLTRRILEGLPARPSAAEMHFAAQHAGWKAKVSASGRLHSRREFDLASVAALDGLFAISEFSRDNARSIYGRCSDTVVYPIVRFPAGGGHRRGLDRSGLKVLVHSRLDWFKNVDTVLRGFAAFRRTCPSAEIHVVGEGNQRSHLEALASELLEGRGYTFHGFLSDEDLLKVYEACDVFALLTLDEPFGMVYPEAAAKGLLLVGPDHGGPFEILGGGELGEICDPFDPASLTQAFERIWSLGDEEVEARRVRTDAVCRSRFGEAVVIPKLLKVLELI